MIEKIKNCYDSHTHFWATGQVAEGLQLNHLKSVEDIKNLKITENHYRGNWIFGFGWNQNNWPKNKFPDKKILDEVFGTTPVFFSRVDGHASWVNSQALIEFQNKGYDFSSDPKGGVIERDSKGQPTGMLFDQAHINALIQLPEFSVKQNQSFLETAQKIFNQAGFTHVRDMSMNLSIWQLLKKMEVEKKLTINIESFVSTENLNDLARVLNEIEVIKKEESPQLQVKGVKIYIDGSLGSKTAYLSQYYINQNDLSNKDEVKTKGLLIWTFDEIKQLLKQVWSKGLQVSIHTIGDEAVHIAVQAAREVSAEGVLGRLHLEHVQVLRPETILMMKPLHIICHMQPCHWLSDKSWLKQTISEDCVKNLFQWELLRKNKIPFYFGSDSPIEPPSLSNTQRALSESVEWGVPKLDDDWKKYCSHPGYSSGNSIKKYSPNDLKSNNDCYTEIEDGDVNQVYFNKIPLL